MEQRIYIVRHGRTEFNRLGIWQGSGVDSSLDEVGRAQALQFYQKYQSIDFDLIIHSSLRRTKETVQSFLEDGIPALECNDINEISWGHHEGKAHTEKSLEEYRRVVDAWSKEEYEVGFAGGESAQDLRSRVTKFHNFIKSLTYKKILICSHGRTIRAKLCIMQNKPMKEMEQYSHHNTGLFVADRAKDYYTFTRFNDTDHLSE